MDFQVMHECPDLKRYLLSLYDCRYDDFFVQLAKVEQAMKSDRFLNPHYAFYVREMKVRAFAQLTASYRSLTLGKCFSSDWVETSWSGGPSGFYSGN